VAGAKVIGIARLVFDATALQEQVLAPVRGDAGLVEAFVAPYINLASLTLSNLTLLDSYKNQAVTDGLTGLYNRRYMVEYLTSLLNIAKRAEKPLGVLVVDIDNFKRLNDEYGHKTGDLVLREIAHVMRSSLREGDTIARFGGEEFVIVLPESASRESGEVAERVRAAVASIQWDKFGLANVPPVTISIGVAEFPLHGYSHYHLINSADKALYAAKRHGKNRVWLHEHLPPEEKYSGQEAS
jgi:diguanylate cyclase (GGDEF)-like protein